MAVDTQDKRSSALGALLPWMNLHPQPDGDDADTALQRQQMAWSYAGISAGEAEEEAAVVGVPPRRRWYIYPDGRRRYQTVEEARDTLNQYIERKRKPRPERVRKAVEQALEEGDEPALLVDLGLFEEIGLPSMPDIVFDFAPPLIDNTALELVYLRTLDMQDRIAREEAEEFTIRLRRRRAEEEALLALLLA